MTKSKDSPVERRKTEPPPLSRPGASAAAPVDEYCRWGTFREEADLLFNAKFAIFSNLCFPRSERDRMVKAFDQVGRLHSDSNDVKEFTRKYDFYAVEKAQEQAEAKGWSPLPSARIVKIHKYAADLLEAMGGDIIHAAKMGDWSFVAQYLSRHLSGSRTTKEIAPLIVSEEMVRFLVDVLDGKITRLSNSPPKMKTRMRDRELTWFVCVERENGVGADKSIDNAADKFGVSRRRVQQIVSKEELRAEQSIIAQVRALWDELVALHDELVAKVSANFVSRNQ
jgi:hypothetical protein